MRAVSKLSLLALALASAAGMAYFVVARNTAPPAPPKAPVQIVKTAVAEKRALPVTVQTNGYVTAIDIVEVRPQVQNVIRQVHVREGQDVAPGQLLFTLDERGDAASLDKAHALIDHDRADVADAEVTLKRNQELFARGFVSQSVVDSARNKVDSLRGTLQADRASAQGGQVTLGFNRITAGIGGRLGAINVHPGSLAQPGALPLVTIARLDPISVSFTVPEAQLAYIHSSYPNGDAPVSVQIPGGPELRGKLRFIDNAVDTTTGTIRMKAEFANPDKLLWPGAFVNVSLVARVLPDAVTIPPQAVVTGPSDKFVYLVQDDGSVKIQQVNVLAIENGVAAVNNIAAGARVVVEGGQNLRPDSKVKEAGTADKAVAANSASADGKAPAKAAAQ